MTRAGEKVIGRCEGCGEMIYDDDQFCYDGSGHVVIGYDKEGNPEQQPCGPINREAEPRPTEGS